MTSVIRGVVAAGCLVSVMVVACVPDTEARQPRSRAAARQAADKKPEKGKRQRLAAITREFEKVQRQGRVTRGREHAVLSDLEEMDRTLLDRKRQLAVIGDALRRTQEDMKRSEQEELAIEARVTETRAALKQRAVALYQSRQPRPVVLLVGARDAYDLVVRSDRLRRIAQREADLVQSLNQSLILLEERRRQLTQSHAQLLDQRQAAASASLAVERERQKKGLLLAAVRRERTLYEQTAGELETAATRLRALMQRSPVAGAPDTTPQTGVDVPRAPALPGPGVKAGRFPAEKGRLPWPHDGMIAATFGRQWHPRFHVYVERKGIEILAKAGEPIRVVHGGTIVYADWFKGYGLLVIVDHGDQYYSLYAHAARALVRVGDRVVAGQVVGEVGDTGLTQEGRLYFEIRHQGDPLNPLAWLNRRRGTQEE